MLTAIALTLSLLVHVANAVPAFALGDYSTDSNPAQHHSRRAVCANGKYPVYNSCCFTQCSCGITVCGCATMKTSSWGGIQCGSSCGNECVSCNVCTDCPAGKYGNNDECHDCAANKYTDQKSQTSCKNCNAGYYSNTGATFCAEVNECLSNPCQNGGVCDNQIDSYDCSCPAGYTGTNCQTNIDECASSPCQHGATCYDGVNGYTCTCVPGYTGTNCQTNIDECASNPCQNGATCVDLVNGYLCNCELGYDGTLCNNNINECASSPCQNGASCVDGVNGYTCTCVPGYNGILCSNNINECASVPCQNGATCVDVVNGYTCSCVPGYTGTLCESDMDECASSPCQNGAVCTQSIAYYTCACVAGYAGTNCETNVNECASNPCHNDATCVDGINGYTCSCAVGWFGLLCDVEVDECGSAPCVNGAECLDTLAGFLCTCVTGYTGIQCETNIDECASSPCQNFAACVDAVNAYSCICRAGYAGIHCETDIDECVSNPCQNSGTCVDAVNGYSCTCPVDYYGTECAEFDDCYAEPCLNGASCAESGTAYECTCAAGYDGDQCQVNIDECASSPCTNGGVCTDQVDAYACSCPQGFLGIHCETDFDECASTPCQNGAPCSNLPGAFFCDCTTGWYGEFCEADTNECASSPCTNGATCVDLQGTYECRCASGYRGVQCETDIDECSSSPCSNGASCADQVDGFVCTCASGFAGVVCETELNECDSSPCSNGANCTDALDGFVCTCASGFTGVVCESNVDECASSPCSNGASCNDQVDGFVCVCASGFTGNVCETNVDECLSSPCSNGANCTDAVDGFSCVCPSGFTGVVCESNVDECHSSPCSNGATCLNELDYFTCLCASGFTDSRCQTNVDECESAPCSNGATCLDGVDGFSCVCASGFVGIACESEVDECASSPCSNGANCTDAVDGFVCMCASGFTGVVCESNVDECASSPCTNGAVCSNNLDAYTCTCPSGFTGVDCETNVDECESSPCSNGASCVDGVDEYLCVCASGFTGTHCETEEDECASSPCQHGGVCTDHLDGFTCACPDNVHGVFCQSDCRAVSIITTQDRLNRLAGCWYTLTNNLTVSGSGITNLVGLYALETTNGTLRIENTLAPILYLDRLVQVSGHLEILNNPKLESAQLTELITVEGHLTLTGSPLLTTAPMNSIMTVGASPLTLSNLPLLDGASLDTLSKVPFAGVVTIENTGATSLALLNASTAITHLTVSSNAALTTLAGWESAATTLFSELASLSIDDNSALTSFTCPSLLFRFASTVSISISRNRALTTLDCSFATLTAASTVLLADDTSLTTLSGFHALTHASSVTLSNSGLVSVNELAFASLNTADLIISDNAKLLSLEASGFALAMNGSHTGSLTISGNEALLNVGFDHVITLHGSLTISDNERLVDIAGFQRLAMLNGTLTIANNTFLSVMTTIYVDQVPLNITGALHLTDNADLCVNELLDVLDQTVFVAGNVETNGTAQTGSPPCLLHALRVVAKGGVNSTEKADETIVKLTEVTDGDAWTSVQDAESASQIILKSLDNILVFVQRSNATNETTVESAAISNRTLSVLNNVLSPTSLGRINSGNSTANRIATVVESFVEILETVAICDGDALTLHGTNLNVEIQRSSNSSDLRRTYGDGSIMLPDEFAMVAGIPTRDCYDLQFIAYSTSPFVSTDKNATTTASNVVSFTVNNITVSGLTNETGILVTLTHTGAADGVDLACVYWDKVLGAWSTEGVTMVSQTATQTVCRTLHLTNFAMLALPTSRVSSLGSGATKALTVLTYLGCCASLVGIVFIWLTYYLVPSFRSHAIKLLLHLSVMLFMLNITFLAGIDATGNSIGCSFVAVFLYFLLMAAFAWMLAISHNLYFLVVRVIGEPTSVMRYAVVCYCVPLAMTLVLLIVDLCTDSAVGLGDANRCWISSDLGLYLAVLLPIACVILVNLIVFVRATRALLNSGPKHHKSMYPKRTRENPSQSVGVQRSSTLLSRTSTFLSRSTTRNTTRNKNYPKRPVQHDPSTHFKAIKLASGLLTSLGLAWIIAFVALATNEPVFWYFFVVLNASQGLLLAIFFVFLGRARKDLVKKLNLHNPMTALRRQFTTLSSPGSTRSSATALTTGASSSTLVPNGKRVQRGSVPVAKQKPLEPKRSGAWVSDGAFASQASVVMQMDDDDDDLRAVDEMEMEQMNQHAAGYSEVEMAQMHTMLSTDELDMTIVPAAVMLQDHELRAYVTPEEHETVEDSHFDDGSIFDAFSDCGSSDDLLGGDRSVPMSPIAVTRMRMAISRGSVGQSNESLSPSPSPATSSPALFSPIPPRQMSRLMAPSNANVWQSPASLISSADADGDDRSLDDGMLLRDHGDHSAGLQRNMSVRL